MATKTTSVRAEEETIEKFDKLAEEYNITKTDLFPQLLEAYQEKKLKEKVPGRADDIDGFGKDYGGEGVKCRTKNQNPDDCRLTGETGRT